MTVRTEPIQDKNFRMGTVVLELDNGVILTCHNFRRNRNGDLKLLAWVPLAEKWMYVYANNKFKMRWLHVTRNPQKVNKAT